MLKFFAALLILIGGATASEICDAPPFHCMPTNLPREFPATEEELKILCEAGINYLECAIKHEEQCGDINAEELLDAKRALDTVKEICSEDTLLHAAVVDNLKCFSNMVKDDTKFCDLPGNTNDSRIQEFTAVLVEEGLVSLTDDENENLSVHECILLMNFFACNSIAIENECGIVAMNAYLEIILRADPAGMQGCSNLDDTLPAIIRLRKAEEEKEENIEEIYRKRK